MKILIIDDSRTMRRLLTSYVAPLQAETVEAADGQQALDALELYGPFDLALVDWDMPVMNGLEFVKAVRSDPSQDGLQLMMVTAQNSLEAVTTALTHGANDYLMKPLTEEMVLDKLRVLGLAV